MIWRQYILLLGVGVVREKFPVRLTPDDAAHARRLSVTDGDTCLASTFQ